VERSAGVHSARPPGSGLRWLVYGRFAALLLCVLATLSVLPAPAATYAVLFGAAVLNTAYLWAGKRVGARPLAIVQVLVDLVIVGALVYLMGIDRSFAPLFFAIVVASAMTLGAKSALVMASASTIVLAAVSTLYFLSGSPGYAFELPLVDPDVIAEHTAARTSVLRHLFFLGLGLHAVAFLSGRLTLEARRARILDEEILAKMADGVVAAGADGTLRFVNDQAVRMLGIRDPVAAVGRRVEESLPPEVANLVRQAIVSDERVAREIRVNGFLLGAAVSHLKDADRGALRGVVAILNDLSLRAQVEEATRRTERLRALVQISAGMAHEIRNPLASIRGAAQELATSAAVSGEDQQLLGVVVSESDRLNRIVGDFLDFASDRPLEKDPVDMAALLEEGMLLLAARPGGSSVEIIREIPERLPCRGVADKLKQVFLNLGLNAFEACAHAGRPGRLVVRARTAPGPEGDGREGVLVEFQDNGVGVRADDLGRVFDPFFTTKAGGTGMGLAVARRLIQRHEGHIALVSEEGKGTTVRVWLPA
jgi:two-component system sensor histidine kinase PilS (NtrC family)